MARVEKNNKSRETAEIQDTEKTIILKDKLTKKQKKALIRYISDLCFGTSYDVPVEQLEFYKNLREKTPSCEGRMCALCECAMACHLHLSLEEVKGILKTVNKGGKVRYGYLPECYNKELVDFRRTIWNILEETGDNNFWVNEG